MQTSSHTYNLDDGWDILSRDHLARIVNYVDSMDIRSPPRPILTPSEYLKGYSIVYSLCTAPESNNEESLYLRVSQLFSEYINRKVTSIGDSADTIVETWIRYRSYVFAVSNLFSYLDRFYVYYSYNPSMRCMGLEQFRNKIFVKHKATLKNTFLEMLDHKRTATDIDEFTADALSQMFNELDSSGQGQYKMEIEPEIIERASKYYTTMAAIWVEDCNLVDYVSIVEHCLEQERKDCDRWLHKTTKVHLMDTLYSVLIKSREKELLNKLKEFGSVVDEGNEADIGLIYKLLHDIERSVVTMAESLKGCVQSYGSKINSLEDILASWLHYQGLLERCFSYKSQNATIENGESDGMDQSSTGLSAVSDNCSSLVDRYEIDPQITQATRLGFKYVISHHVDFVKKLVDHWDNVLVSGIDVDKRLRQCCDLLELSEENTCFSQCYKYKLAARLLYETSSLQKEQLSLSMLEPCIPSEEAAQLRRMIKEATEARSTKAHDKIKLISKANWPSLRDYAESIKLHTEFELGISEFHESQRNQLHRQVVINRMLGRAELELDSRKLICDLVQASAVLLFTEDSMPVDDLASGLGVNKDAAISIIKPLVDKGVLRLAGDDTVELNSGFVDGTDVTVDAVPSYRTNMGTAARGSAIDPLAAIDACIMSLLKSVKSLKRDDLLLQLSHFSREDLLARVENLRGREYLTLSEDTITYLP